MVAEMEGGAALYGRPDVGMPPSVGIYEEGRGTLKRIMNFDEVAEKEAGKGYFGRFVGVSSDNRCTNTPKSACDAVREKLVYRNSLIFDLPTGAHDGHLTMKDRAYDDFAFDKKGYLHVHSWPECIGSSLLQGRVWRLDPARPQVIREQTTIDDEFRGPVLSFPEVPYDYGEVRGPGNCWQGALRTMCQPSSHGFQHGLGVNMRGDLAVCSRIWYQPRMEDELREIAFEGVNERRRLYAFSDGGGGQQATMNQYARVLEEMKKRGDEIYFIRREPGIPLAGDT